MGRSLTILSLLIGLAVLAVVAAKVMSGGGSERGGPKQVLDRTHQAATRIEVEQDKRLDEVLEKGEKDVQSSP
jgi:hypothetical protein